MKRCLLAILMALTMLYPAAAAAYSAVPPEDYGDYRDIPGVTPEQIEAVEALRARGRAFTYGMAYSSEAFRRADGSIGGFAQLFCEQLTDLFGMEFAPEIYDWTDLQAAFRSGGVDFTGEMTAGPQREGRYYTTGDPIARRMVRVFRLPESLSMEEMAQAWEPRLIFLEESAAWEVAAQAIDYPFVPVFAENSSEALVMLAIGEGDAFLTDRPGQGLFDEEMARYGGELVSEAFYPVAYAPVSLAAADGELAPIVEIVQLYLEQGGGQRLTELYLQGEKEYLRNKLYLELSGEERAYLERLAGSGETVPVAAEYDNYPVSFYDEEEGGYRGIAMDVLEEIGALTGLVFAPLEERREFPELLELLESGEAALLSELIYSHDRDGRFLWTQEPYTADYYALLSLSDRETASFYEILTARVGVLDQTAYQEVFEDWFPGHPSTMVYENSDEIFDALEAGEIDLMIGSRNLVLSMTNYRERPGFEVNLVFDREVESRFGFHIGERELASIVSKAQGLVDTETITDRWTRKGFDYRTKVARMQIPYLVMMFTLMGSILLLVFVLYLRNRNMTRELEATVQKRTRELEVQTQAAQVASQAKGEFLTRMSHEIRTPLNAVMGMAQIARMSDELPESARGQLDEILKASGHLLGILNDVLDMSKIESGKMTLVSEPFTLFTALDEVVSIFQQRCEEKKIAFRSNCQDLERFDVLGDKLHLKQVLINLLGNAVKFTPEGGEIDFIVESKQAAEGKAALSFTVKDSGIGMTKEQQARLFTAFEQADNTIAARFGGSGLGLAISQYLVGQMGGEITIDSRPGEGSAFFFQVELPKIKIMEKPTEEQSEQTPDLSGKRILLAEDIEINRIILLELLKDTGISIDQAEDGQKAAELFAQSPVGYYDLIFMDVQMPNMNGYEATVAIRGLPRSDAAAVPIIAMTANAYNDDIAKERDAGMNGHVSKPIDIAVVKKLLADRLLGAKAAR